MFAASLCPYSVGAIRLSTLFGEHLHESISAGRMGGHRAHLLFATKEPPCDPRVKMHCSGHPGGKHSGPLMVPVGWTSKAAVRSVGAGALVGVAASLPSGAIRRPTRSQPAASTTTTTTTTAAATVGQP